MQEPAAYLIVQTTKTERRVLVERAFRNAETAQAAATRMTNRWRTCEAIPVYEKP